MNENSEKDEKLKNYQACMVLACIGDVMGYKCGNWQYLKDSIAIHEQMMKLTENKGPLFLKLDEHWKYSDDTVMHIATAEALLSGQKKTDILAICQNIAKSYKKCWQRMEGRGPGSSTKKSIAILKEDGSNWNQIPYTDKSKGCGGAMRSACIGLVFYDDIQKLIPVSIEAGRITHHNPIGYLGSMVSSYFTSLAIRKIQPKKWAGYLFEEAFPLSQKHVRDTNREVALNFENGFWQTFITYFTNYCKERNVSMSMKEDKEPQFPQNYDVSQRDKFYHKFASLKGWPGSSGVDSVLIAYDALLSSKGSWEQLCLRAVLHGGDNDSTGSIAGAWFGTYYGWQGVPENHYQKLQDRKLLMELGEKLYNLRL